MAEIPLGLLGFAAGAMGAGQTPSNMPMGFGQALSGGLLSGLNNYAQLQGVQNQNSQNQMRQMALMQQMKAQSQAQQQEAAKQQALEQYVSGLPEDQQALARVAPDAVVKGVVERQFRAPEPPKSRSRAVGGVEVFEEWNPQALKWEQVSEAPRWAPPAPRQAQIFGSATTGYYTMGSDGRPQRLVAGQEPGAAEATTALKTRAAKIADAVAQFGISQAEATSLVDGYTRTITDPVTGLSLSYNEATQAVRPIDEPRQTQVSDQQPPERSLYETAGNVAGVAPALAEAGSAVTGQVGGPVAEQIIEDRQMIRSTQNELIRALSINPRYPVGEIERLTREINIAPRFWDSPDSLRARMRSVDQYLDTRVQNELRAANNTNLPRQTRQDAAAAAEAISNYRNVLGAEEARLTTNAGRVAPSTGTTSSGVGWSIVE